MPYVYLLVKFNIPEHSNVDNNSFVDIDLSRDDVVYELKNIYPTPTYIGVNRIRYVGKKDVEALLNSGSLYIAAEDVKEIYKKDKMFMVTSVLLGTILAFIMDIVIQLIYKWRRLNK